jgi:hypothetical protein
MKFKLNISEETTTVTLDLVTTICHDMSYNEPGVILSTMSAHTLCSDPHIIVITLSYVCPKGIPNLASLFSSWRLFQSARIILVLFFAKKNVRSSRAREKNSLHNAIRKSNLRVVG